MWRKEQKNSRNRIRAMEKIHSSHSLFGLLCRYLNYYTYTGCASTKFSLVCLPIVSTRVVSLSFGSFFLAAMPLRIPTRITNSHSSRVIQNTQRYLVKGDEAVILAVGKIKFVLWPLNFKWMENNGSRRARTFFYIIFFFVIITCDKNNIIYSVAFYRRYKNCVQMLIL